MTMIDDPIVAEVRQVRDRHAAKFNYDLDAIYRDLKEKEKASGRTYLQYPPRLCGSQLSPATIPSSSTEAQVQTTCMAGRA